MEVITIIFIAVGLAMDAFAVSVAAGAAERDLKIGHALRLAVFFGAFQALMPLVGWAAGMGFKDVVQAYDHWVAFGLLAAIGGKMIYESFKLKTEDEGTSVDVSSLVVVVVLSVATSIDALAVGVTLTLVTDHVAAAVIVIGVITFGLSLLGCRIGEKVGHWFENRIEAVGGLILIGIGVKILAEHLIGR
ncbi:manganese efflux pump MntP family protein [Anaerohalosphaera lusitana]|uniref:manganese efflux pump MntP n=1 Tax=Anaerohalosphaera lusitana TaxID=1936003 RepID=UPI00197CB529|nr:manganese efflux pump MntP family protein [Anaerohalosphaera lusitana]